VTQYNNVTFSIYAIELVELLKTLVYVPF